MFAAGTRKGGHLDGGGRTVVYMTLTKTTGNEFGIGRCSLFVRQGATAEKEDTKCASLIVVSTHVKSTTLYSH